MLDLECYTCGGAHWDCECPVITRMKTSEIDLMMVVYYEQN